MVGAEKSAVEHRGKARQKRLMKYAESVARGRMNHAPVRKMMMKKGRESLSSSDGCAAQIRVYYTANIP